MGSLLKAFVVGVLALTFAQAQTVIAGGAKLAGGATTTNGFTSNRVVTMVFPPGTGSADFAKLRAAGSAWDNSLIDGVTVQIKISDLAQINTFSTGGQQPYIPSTTPAGTCAPYTGDTDTCIKMDGAQIGKTFRAFAAPIYFPFSWTTIESTTSPGINGWFQPTPGGVRKTVNFLDFSQSNGAINGSTPSYVGTTDYMNLFSPARQDALNALQTTPCSNGQYGGHTGLAASRSGSSVVTVTLNSHGYTTNQHVFVAATAGSGTFAQYSVATLLGAVITVTGANTFTYDSGVSATDTATLTLVADSESWLVPYELPYVTLRQAAYKAIFLHYGSGYTNAQGGTAAQLGYWRGGQGAGGEAVPFCYAQMQDNTWVGAPYTLAADTATVPGVGDNCFSGGGCNTWGFTTYYNNDLIALEKLHPYLRVLGSLNGASSGGNKNFSYARAEQGLLAGRTNGAGLFDGMGEQGVALSDVTSKATNPTQAFTTLNPNLCGNDGCHMAETYAASGMPVEIQPVSISAYDDGNCTTQAHNGAGNCGGPSSGNGGDSGDMRVWLGLYTGLPENDGSLGHTNVTLSGTASIFECYYRDCGLALDPHFCDLDVGATTCTASYTDIGGYTWWLYSTATAYEFHAFQTVGLGPGCVAQYGTTQSQNGTGGTGLATGDCSYAAALKAFHGQH